MKRFAIKLLSILGMLLLSALPALTQQHPAVERGFSADKTFQFSDIDSVSTFNGAAAVRIPIGGSYPSGGSFAYQLNLTYSSKLWDFEELGNPQVGGPNLVRSLPAAFTNGGFGWTLTLGRLIHPDDPSNETGRWQYLDPSGGRHGLYPTAHPGDQFVAGFSYTRSGTYLRSHELANGNRTLEFPNGDVHTFSSSGFILRLEDQFGNFLSVTYPNATEWHLKDRHGRVHKVLFKSMTSDGQAVNVLDRIELPAFNGTTATYTFEHTSKTIFPACTDTFRGIAATLEVPVLDRVLLPDGSSFDFTYLESGCSDGLLKTLTLPTLGQIEYGWGIWVLPTEGCDEGQNLTWAQRTSGVTSRTFINADGSELGKWSYAQILLGPPTVPTGLCTGLSEDPSEVSQTTVTTPNGHRSVHFFSVWPNVTPALGSPNGFQVHEYGVPFDRTRTDATGTRFLSSQIYEGTTLKRSIYVRYEYDNRCTIDPESRICQEANKRLASRRTVYHDDGDRFADEDFSDFDGLGHYRTTTTGGNFPTGNVRTSFTNYNPGHDLELDADLFVQPGYVMWPTTDPWVLNTYTEQTVTEVGATAKVQTCFDTDTGVLLRQRIMKASSPNKNDVIAKFTYSGEGNLSAEEYYGGDVQSVSVSANLCNLALPTAQYRMAHTYSSGSLATSRYTNADGSSVGFVSTELTIDPNTGLVASSRDPAGIVTSFEYDDMGRLLWEKPMAGHGAWTQYVFTQATSAVAPAKVQVLRRANGNEAGAILEQSQVLFDGFGRVWRERRLMPGLSWVMRETLYNAEGQKTQVSEWADEDADPFVQHWTEFMDYDAFGRPATIRPPDGSAHDVTFTYTGDRISRRTVKIATSQTTETDSQTIERYDRQGRLYQVVEPSGTGGANVTTTYSYDIGNRLTKVRTPASGVTQVRDFVYDNRGFLLSESHPEKDGLVTYSSYDARGHAQSKVDGTDDLNLAYDAAERLVEIRETGGAQRLLKTFNYASVNSGGAWQKGKLERATRYNYYNLGPYVPADQIFVDGFECGNTSAWGGLPTCGNIQYNVAVEETYTYGGKGGQVSKRDTAITLNGNTGETFTQGWTYTDLGNVATLTYPKCDFNRCTSDGAGISRTVSNVYTRGYLTGVTDYATSIIYHPSSLVNTITHANSVVVTQGVDPNGMGRPASITAIKGATTHWSTGSYEYDGAGNIAGIGKAYYVYDSVNRLTTGALPIDRLSTGALKTQSYGYDSFGNIQTITGTSGRTTPTSSATNRLAGTAVYDAAGNLTSWNGNSYEYDAFNMMKRMRSGGEDWLYVYTVDDERVWQFRRSDQGSFHRYTLRDLSGKVLRQYTSTGDFWVVDEDYIYRYGSLLSAETPAGKRHFHLDHLGTPRLITDAGGNRVAFHAYYPFGEEATNAFQDQERLKFTSHERDLADPGGTGDDLDYMHARFCSPWTSRFMSVDPANGNPSHPQTWNRYAYALDNPIKYIDPDGRAVDIIVDIGFVIFDIGDIATSLIAGEGVSGGQLLALGGDVVGALVPFATGLGAAARALAKSDDAVDGVKALDELTDGTINTFEILDGVRRSKSADFVGNQTIPAQIFDARGRSLGMKNISVDSLLSPKEAIDISTERAKNRFFKNNLEPAKAGSVPPPIQVTPGTRGTPIRDVTLDPHGVQ